MVTICTGANVEPNPRIIIIRKKRIAHNCGIGMSRIASGKITNDKPGPETATALMSTLIETAKNPRIAKMANPA